MAIVDHGLKRMEQISLI